MRIGQLRALSYRQVLDHYQLILCDNPATCRRHLSVHAHRAGYADVTGYIHWSRADTLVTRRGMRRLLMLIGSVFLKHDTRRIPVWLQLYESNLWAWAEGMKTWHIQFTQEMSKGDRLRAARLAGPNLRTVNFPAYMWTRGRKKNWLAEHRTSGSS